METLTLNYLDPPSWAIERCNKDNLVRNDLTNITPF